MKVVGLYLIRNEVDLIETNLLHHFDTAIDEAIVVDNGSTDGTFERVASLAASMPIHLTREDGPYDQSARVTRMARAAVEGGAHWLLPLDADEFWIGTETSLRSALSEAAPDITALQADVVNFVQARHVLTADPASLLTMTMRPERQVGPIESCEGLVERGEIGFVEMKYPPKLVSRAFPDIVIHPGNHGTGGVPDAKIAPGQILCMHAPLRARSLFTGKLDQGRRVIEEDPGRQDYWHVRRWWRLARQGMMTAEWAANSYLDGSITVGGHVKALVQDTRLRDAVRSFIPEGPTTNSDGDDALDPAIAAYLLALASVPGSLSELDCRLITEIDRLQREHEVSGPLLQIGASSTRTAVLLAYLSTLSEPLTVCATIHDDADSTTDLSDRKRFEQEMLRFHDRLPEILVGGSGHGALDMRAHTFRLLSMEESHGAAISRHDVSTARSALVEGGVAVFEHADLSSSGLAEVLAEESFQPICSTPSRLFVAAGPMADLWAQAIGAWAANRGDVRRTSRPLGEGTLWHLADEPPTRRIDADDPRSKTPDEDQGGRDRRDADYDADFFDFVSMSARSSAQKIVPFVLELTEATSVVDIGCGTGTWLSVFTDHGVRHVLGLDGTHVDQSRLEIPASDFLPWDLEEALPVARRFDLAVCLEVAEHVSPGRADAFVAELAVLAPMILFSAAIPFQGGHGHVNEQWPSYWARKFADRGMSVIDVVRPEIWDSEEVAMWYSQNCLLFASPEALDERPRLREHKQLTNLAQIDLVHPSVHLYHHLGIDRPTARVPLDMTMWPADAPHRTVSGDDAHAGDPQPSDEIDRQPDIGLRALLQQLPSATARTIGPRWRRLRRR